ncbi:putative enzyme related to lactoylglutathione lyase [Kribbella rubisoli]|uniref:Enzyme related to lactoylglutathione lyase n=1 Tax=Kribbella rubisoli TaxID=3075929 RepID=A0A4Q7WJ51_9ACTN|nr:VOC family protein [Kribbella rubisoli]RZU10174.1 putative enzyme related to lactoylglutathione lyase [Kribbella rubisoli]
MDSVGVRYIVYDVAAAVTFYTDRLGFTVEMDYSPGFAAVTRGGLRLMLNNVGGIGGASQPMPDGRSPEPGGWNRFQIVVDDLAAEVARLRAEGATFRNEIVVGVGGSQILLEDPAGNVIELFQPAN